MDSAAGYAQMNGILSAVPAARCAQRRVTEHAKQFYAQWALLSFDTEGTNRANHTGGGL